MTLWSFEARVNGSLPIHGEVNADTEAEAREEATQVVIEDAPPHHRATEDLVEITELSRQ